MTAPRIIDRATIARSVSAADLVTVLRAAFLAPGAAPVRTAHSLPAGDHTNTLLMMPAWQQGGGLGVKIVTVAPGNAHLGLPSVSSIYVLMFAETGQLRAILDGDMLTALRTAAVSALAADVLAPPDARSLLMVGTGTLAPHLVAAHCSVRAMERIVVWGRNPAKAADLVAELAGAGIAASATDDLANAARAADIVSCATLSEAPLIEGAWLCDGAHLDLVGAFRPEMREADGDAIADAAVVVDTLAALDDAGDLTVPLAQGRIARESVRTLTEALNGDLPRGGRISVFKTIGTAIADLAAAEAIVEICTI